MMFFLKQYTTYGKGLVICLFRACQHGMILYTILFHIILLAALVITHHVQKNTDQPWWQASRKPDSQYLSEYCSFFWSHMSTIILIITSSWWYDQIYMGRKTTEFSFLWDHRLRFWTPPNSDDPGKRVGPFLTLPTLFSHSFHLSWQWVEVGVFVGQKKVSSLYFSIFHAELVGLTFFMPSFQNQL